MNNIKVIDNKLKTTIDGAIDLRLQDNKISLKDCLEEYAEGDIFYPQRYFLAKWNTFGSRGVFHFTQDYLDEYPNSMFEYDIESAIKFFKEKFGNEDLSIMEDLSFNEKDETNSRQTYIIFNNEHVILYVESSPLNMCFYYDNFDNLNIIKKYCFEYIRRVANGDWVTKISYIIKTFSGYDLVDNNIKHYDVDIATQYNDDFAQRHEQIKEFINEENKSGLVILSGDVGTGKTTYIRHLIESSKKRFVYLTSELANALADPAFISFLYNIKGAVLIIEDCENLVRSREAGNYTAGISTILNTCDGLMGDVFDLKIIATFNADVSKIDSALLRKGRLICRYEFGKLSKDKANALLERLGKNYVTDCDMSLCDIYNLEIENGSKEKEKTKIGF